MVPVDAMAHRTERAAVRTLVMIVTRGLGIGGVEIMVRDLAYTTDCSDHIALIVILVY